MKKLSVVHVETQAFDNQKVTLKGADATVKIHLHDAKEFDSFKIGDEVTISFDSKAVAPKKVAKAVAPKKVTATA